MVSSLISPVTKGKHLIYKQEDWSEQNKGNEAMEE